MKHKNLKISSLILLCSLFIISSMSVSVYGAFPAYVGVSVGDELVWTINPKSAGIDPLIQDYNNSANLGNGQVNLPSWLSSDIIDIAQLEIAINITGEGGTGDISGVPYANLTCNGQFRIIGIPIVSIPTFEMPIFDSSMLYFNETLLSLNKSIDGFVDVNDGTLFLIALIVSPSINWTQLVGEFKQARDYLGVSTSDIAINALTNGFEITIAEGFFNETHSKKMIISMEFKDNGVLSKGEVKYDGLTAVLITEGASSIPGFEIPLMIGITSVSIIGVIHVMKKKKKILN